MNHHHIQWACRLNRLVLATAWGLTFLSPAFWGQANSLVLPLVLLALATLVVGATNELLFHVCARLKESSDKLKRFSEVALVALSMWLLVFSLGLHQALPLILLAVLGLEAQFLRRSGLAVGIYLGSGISVLALAALPAWNPIGLSGGEHVVFCFTHIAPFFVPLLFLGHILDHVVGVHSHQVETLQSLASTDGLTGLINRRQFNARLQAEVSRAQRHHSPLSLALFDIDNFKHINDYYGHPVGDRILKEMGKLLTQSIRESDVAARYGGEEFALILPETREKEASDLLERIRQAVSETVFCLPDNPITLTVSIGVSDVNLRASKQSPFELIERADTALYEAKGTGKNKVISASTLLTSPLIQPIY
jgi:diguanylate cyclase (GGDEF)-like protein